MRKQTAKQKILKALKTKGMKPQEIAKATGLNINYVYATLHTLHKNHEIAKDDDGVYIIQRPNKLNQERVEELTSKTIKTFKDTIESQRKEIDKYHTWCLEWRKLIDESKDKEEQLNAVIERSFAVIHYLEQRIEKLTIQVHNPSKE
jgi:transposase